MFVWLLTASLAACARSPESAISGAAQRINIVSLPNAARVTDRLYRGAQPRPGGLAELKNLGVTTVVDLRGEDSQTRDQERQDSQSLGINFVSIPASGWAPPSAPQIQQFLALFADPKAVVFVHCHYGQVRTGVFIAAYRMSVEKWSADLAIREMYAFGFSGLWHPAMLNYVRAFPTTLTSLQPTSIAAASKL
jgi:protein tyrosine/serine phosphatase